MALHMIGITGITYQVLHPRFSVKNEVLNLTQHQLVAVMKYSSISFPLVQEGGFTIFHSFCLLAFLLSMLSPNNFVTASVLFDISMLTARLRLMASYVLQSKKMNQSQLFYWLIKTAYLFIYLFIAKIA